jgi:hypothetical protein
VNNDFQVAALLAIHRSLCGFDGASSARLHLNETQNIVVPSDQINFAVMPSRASSSRPSHIHAFANKSMRLPRHDARCEDEQESLYLRLSMKLGRAHEAQLA